MPPADHVAVPDASTVEAPAEGVAPTVGAHPSKFPKKYAKMMLYTHPKVARKIKEIAFTSERKANDVILEALDRYFAATGHTGMKHVIEN